VPELRHDHEISRDPQVIRLGADILVEPGVTAENLAPREPRSDLGRS
jgi:hypothetical protein